VTLGPWLFRHRQAVTLPIVEQFFKVDDYITFLLLSKTHLKQALRSEKGITRIEAVGYCFGGLYVLLAGSAQLHLVDAIVGCHVSLANKTHFEQLQVPAAFACAQEDDQFSDAFRAEVEQILARKPEIPSKFLLTDGTVHGFASRPNPDNPVTMKGYKQANDLIIEWAKTHL
jgi:dienelactone hydrolase